MILISDAYRAQQRELHSAPRGYGGSGWRWAGLVAALVERFETRTWLDYGCGRETLRDRFRIDFPTLWGQIEYTGYDPARRGIETLLAGPPMDLITCTDVLEHVEPEYLPNVLSHLFSMAGKVVFFNINLKPANKILPDGRNAHLIQRPADWWIEAIKTPGWDIEILTSPRPGKDFNAVMMRSKRRSTIWANKAQTELVPNTYQKDTICKAQLAAAHLVFSSPELPDGRRQEILRLLDKAFDFGKRMDERLAEYRRLGVTV